MEDIGIVSSPPVERRRVVTIWLGNGAVGIGAGAILWSRLGASLSAVRPVVGLWLVAVGAFAAVRRRYASESAALLLAAALVLVAVGGLVAAGTFLSLPAVKAMVGAAWIGSGGIELAASRSSGWTGMLLSRWLSAACVLAGVVTIGFPTRRLADFTFLAALWALVLGAGMVVRAIRMVVIRSDRRSSRLRAVVGSAVPALLMTAVLVVFAVMVVYSAGERSRQRTLAPFYEPPADLASWGVGDIIKTERLEVAGLDGTGWRVMFRSEDRLGNPTVSTGMIFAPAGEGSDRPVVAWAHGTVGLAPECAYSRLLADPTADMPWLNEMLARGFVVTAPDYAGAGGTGPGERYLVVAEQSRDVLNAVRAARSMSETGAGDRFAVYGHSQGGLIALGGAALQPTYAPELDLVGVGAISAASYVGPMLAEVWENPRLTWTLGPILVDAWVRTYQNLDPAVILSEAGMTHLSDAVENNCVISVVPQIVNPLMGRFLSRNPADDPQWRQALLENEAPPLAPDVPAFVGHGLDDRLILPSLSARLVTEYCAAGNPVTVTWMDGVHHLDAAAAAGPNYVDWVTALFAGDDVADDCGAPIPVAPIQPLS